MCYWKLCNTEKQQIRSMFFMFYGVFSINMLNYGEFQKCMELWGRQRSVPGYQLQLVLCRLHGSFNLISSLVMKCDYCFCFVSAFRELGLLPLVPPRDNPILLLMATRLTNTTWYAYPILAARERCCYLIFIRVRIHLVVKSFPLKLLLVNIFALRYPPYSIHLNNVL